MAKPNTSQHDELADLRNRIEWLEGERRKLARRVAEVEQKHELSSRDKSGHESRLQDLEKQVTANKSQISRLPRVDVQLAQFKDEVVKLIEQYDQRRIQSSEESDRLRRVEQEAVVRDIGAIRKELTTLQRLQQDMELRQAEEARLSNLIGQLQNRLSAVENRIEGWDQSLAFLEEKEKQNGRNIADVQTAILEINKRWTPINDRLEVFSGTVLRLENSIQELSEKQVDLSGGIKEWLEQIQVGEYERNQRLDDWRRVLDEHTDTIDRFSKEWVKFSDQYKEAKMAIQTLGDWQKQIQQQQREQAELLRVESHRMQSRWDDFKHESDKRWRTVEVEAEQRWANVARHERQFQEQIMALEKTLESLEQDKELLERIQTAQADAIKQIPRLWLEEIEKAVQQDPHRRRQPALVSTRNDSPDQ